MSDPTRFAQAVELTTATYDRAAANYAERNAELRPHWRDWMERFVDLLAENEARHPIPELGQPGDDITLEEYLSYIPLLDAGCGAGRDARALAGYGLPVLGVDLLAGNARGGQAAKSLGFRTPHPLAHISRAPARNHLDSDAVRTICHSVGQIPTLPRDVVA